jgi:hypothetical protein
MYSILLPASVFLEIPDIEIDSASRMTGSLIVTG